MRIAVADWNGYISPVFDTARRIRLVESGAPLDLGGQLTELTEDDPAQRALRLSELGVNVLICGAISRPLEAMIAAQGIRIISRVCGAIVDVVHAFRINNALPDEFLMPGCCRRGGGPGRPQMRRRHGCGGKGA